VAAASGAVSLSCTNCFQALVCRRNRSPQKSQVWRRNRERISHCPVREAKLLRMTKSKLDKSGKSQFTCQRAPPKGTQKPGRIFSYASNGTSGQGESGEAASI